MIRTLWDKYGELAKYVVFGVLTTLVNYTVYFGFTRLFEIDYFYSNLWAWFLSVVFAYVTNKIWVFSSAETTLRALLRELSLFFGARVFSGLLDTALLWLLHQCIGLNDIAVKLMNGVLVIILNYMFSKLVIFRRRDAE